MASDLRVFVAQDLRLHPRVAYQGLLAGDRERTDLAGRLPPLLPFRHEYAGAVAVVDWDHRLPSKTLALRIYAYYSQETLEAGTRMTVGSSAATSGDGATLISWGPDSSWKRK